jgi:hypothetical protein
MVYEADSKRAGYLDDWYARNKLGIFHMPVGGEAALEAAYIDVAQAVDAVLDPIKRVLPTKDEIIARECSPSSSCSRRSNSSGTGGCGLLQQPPSA